jgi:catechol 2,3-dioxygenase-like lactoylglutathione lyase family enzyme
VESYVSDLGRSVAFWGWLLDRLGWTPFQAWEGGRSWIRGDTYLVLVQAPADTRAAGFDRRRVGLNHLAFHAASPSDVDALTAELRARGVRILYEDRHPHAGGPGSHAVFFEDPDGLKVEFAADAAPQG